LKRNIKWQKCRINTKNLKLTSDFNLQQLRIIHTENCRKGLTDYHSVRRFKNTPRNL